MQARIVTPLRTAIAAAAAGTVLLSGQAAGAVTTTAATSATGPSGHPGAAARSTLVRVGTFNIDAGVPVARWAEAVRDFSTRVDVGGLQEATGKEKTAALKAVPGIASYVSPRYRQQPIFWNSSLFSLVGGRAPKTAAGRQVERLGGGVTHQETTRATVARLRSKATGRRISVIDVHLLPNAVREGRRVRGVPRRFAMYEQQVQRLGKIVKQEKKWADGPVWLVGDFNDNYVADKKKHKHRLAYATMHRHGLVAAWEAVKGKLLPGHGSGTRSGSYLDVVWSSQGATSVAVLRDEAFRVGQHYPLVSTYPLP